MSKRQTEKQSAERASRLTGRVAGIIAKAAANAALPGSSAIFDLFGTLLSDAREARARREMELIGEELRRIGRTVEYLEEAFCDPRKQDVIYQGLNDAARAVTDARLAHIAKLVVLGISDEERADVQAKRLMALLQELDDEQILVLQSFGVHDAAQMREYYQPNRRMFTVGDREPQSTFYKRAVEDLRLSRLIDLGLLHRDFGLSDMSGRDKVLTVGNFDLKTGTLKAAWSPKITTLGKALLYHIELLPTDA